MLVTFFAIIFIAIAALLITFNVIRAKEKELLEKDLTIAVNRFSGELNSIQRELLVFSQNAILVNGLADNQARDAYLKPLIFEQHFAHVAQFQLSLRNYRGAEIITNRQNSVSLLSAKQAEEAIQEGKPFAQFFNHEQQVFLVLGSTIFFPDSNASQGLVVLEFSVSDLLSQLLAPELDPRLYRLSLVTKTAADDRYMQDESVLTAPLQLEAPLTNLHLFLRLDDQDDRAWKALELLLPFFLGLIFLGLLLSVLLSLWLGKRLAKPILALASAARSVKESGKPNVELSSTASDEIGQLTRDLNAMLLELSQLQGNLESMVQIRSERLSVIFELSPDGFLEIDRQGLIGYVNPAFQTISGIEIINLMHTHWPRLLTLLNQQLATGEAFFAKELPTERIFKMHTPSLKTILLIVRMSPSGSQIMYLRDLTKDAELQAMKSAFFAKAAHELRTPLTSILGFTELLQKDPAKTPKQNQVFEIIFRQGHNLLNLVQDLLELASIEAKPSQVKNQSYQSLPALTRLIATELKMPGDERQLILSLEDHLPEILLNTEQFRQVLSNLWSNAMKYSALGSPIEISTRTREQNGAWIGIAVRDFGIGMSQIELEQIGERFYRANPAGQVKGTGLGIAVVQELMQLHGGVLEFESAPGKGTTVTAWFPSTFSNG